MGSEWKTIPASEFCSSVRDGTHDSPKQVDDGYYLVTSRHITGNRVELEKAYKISEEDFNAVNKRSKVDRWDVLITMIGTVGEPCLIKDEPNFAIKNVGLFKNKGELEGKWLYYYLLSPSAKNLVNMYSRGSTQQYIPLGALREFPVTFPMDRNEMRAIVQILGSLDDKIELNRRMNETLEQMARAIFKSWFVDFDPVRENIKRKDAKSQGRNGYNDLASSRPGVFALPSEILDLFPDGFEETELGDIPKGWEIGVIGDIATQELGGQWGKDKQEDALVPAICLRGCDMEDLRKDGFAQKAPVRFIKKQALEKRLMNENELLIAASGAGPCGRPLWCSSKFQEFYNYPVIYSNFVKRFSTPSKSYAIYLDRLLYEKFLNKSIQDYITGTSVPNLDSNGLLKNCRIVIPPRALLDLFYKQNQPIFNKLYSNENVILANLRDTLLPKLISGELRIPDAEKIVEGAGG